MTISGRWRLKRCVTSKFFISLIILSVMVGAVANKKPAKRNAAQVKRQAGSGAKQHTQKPTGPKPQATKDPTRPYPASTKGPAEATAVAPGYFKHPSNLGAAARSTSAKHQAPGSAATDPEPVVDDPNAMQIPDTNHVKYTGLPPMVVTDTMVVPVVLCNCDENDITGPGEPGPGPPPPPPVMTTTSKPGISTTKPPGPTNSPKPGSKAEIVFVIDRSSNTVLQKYEAVVSKLLAHFQKFFKHESKYGVTTFADFSKDEFGTNYTKNWTGKHPHHNDPEGCYKLQQPLTSDAAKITEMTSKDKITHLGTHTDGGTGSILTAMMVSAVDKKLGWTHGKKPDLKKLLVVITSSESHSPTAFEKHPPRKPVNPNGENKCSALVISPLYQDVGKILNPEGVAVFMIYAKIPGNNRVHGWKSYSKSMKVPFDISNIEDGADTIFDKIKTLIGKNKRR